MRPAAPWLTSLGFTLALVACGPGKSSTTDATTGNPDTLGTTAPGTTGTTTPTTDAATATSTSGTAATTTPDGLTTDVVTSTTPMEDCPPGYSAGCCAGDGECCPCVGFNCADDADAAAIQAFQDCACQADVCGDACSIACAGGGIDGSCFVCADKVGQTTCAGEFAACDGHTSFNCPPTDCQGCQWCAQTSDCYDPWFACWSDDACRDLLIFCAESCSDAACEQACNDEFPAGAALHQAYLDCAYCDACADLCDVGGVTCDP